MKIERVKMLTEMLFENVEMLEEYPEKVKAHKKKSKEYYEKHKDERYPYYNVPYPSMGTSETHIRDIAKLLRKELLKL